jgi:hypothetical protein
MTRATGMGVTIIGLNMEKQGKKRGKLCLARSALEQQQTKTA